MMIKYNTSSCQCTFSMEVMSLSANGNISASAPGMYECILSTLTNLRLNLWYGLFSINTHCVSRIKNELVPRIV